MTDDVILLINMHVLVMFGALLIMLYVFQLGKEIRWKERIRHGKRRVGRGQGETERERERREKQSANNFANFRWFGCLALMEA